MRKFENFLYKKVVGNKDKIIFIDFSYIERVRKNIDISLGIKEKSGGFIGTNWRTYQLDVEDDFSIKEFKETCKKFNISFSVFCGDNEKYYFDKK